jgi:hypothetical protein
VKNVSVDLPESFTALTSRSAGQLARVMNWVHDRFRQDVGPRGKLEKDLAKPDPTRRKAEDHGPDASFNYFRKVYTRERCIR